MANRIDFRLDGNGEVISPQSEVTIKKNDPDRALELRASPQNTMNIRVAFLSAANKKHFLNEDGSPLTISTFTLTPGARLTLKVNDAPAFKSPNKRGFRLISDPQFDDHPDEDDVVVEC